MKKKLFLSIIVLTLVSTLALFMLVGCNDNDNGDETTTPVEVKVCVPDGSPAIAIAKLLQDNLTYDGYNISYEIVTGSEGIGARLASGQATIAIAPTNVGATQYNKNNGKYKLAATAVQGALYMVGKGEVVGDTVAEQLSSLKGKTVYNIGQGATPDLTFKYILDYYQIPYQATATESADYVSLQYVSAGSELIPLLKQGKAQFGIMGEPAVTNANAKAGTTTLFSIQDLWNGVTNTTGGFPQASVLVQNTIADGNHDAFLGWFLTKLEESANWTKTNAEAAKTALTAAGSTSLAGLNANMINKCNISIVRANSAKASVNTYLTALHGFNPQTVGGSIPNDAFYYAV